MKKALETSHLSWILSAFQASRMTAKNKSTKNQTFHLSSWSRPLRLSSWRGVASIGSIAVAFLAACGDEATNQVIQDNLILVSSTKELPKCTKDNEGAEAFVKGETSERICIDGKWTALASSKKDTVVVKDTVIIKDKSSCTTKELKDKSGVKIVCNGDSVGVVLNGKNGAKGDKGDTGAAGKDGTNGKNGTDGAGCTVVTLADNSGLKVVCGGDSVGVVLNGEKGDKGDPGKQGEKGDTGATGKNGTNGAGCSIAQDEKKITITCGDKSSTINLSDIGSSITPDTTVVDSEKVAVSLDSLTGYTQKGPFIKGSTVYLYELMDGRTLKQTNGSFTSNITRDDGRFKFTARDLVSQYVMLVVDGNYRNEVTGKTSNSAIRLKAYSDVRRHATGTVNVNILTHLEFDRVYYLVTREKMTMKKAKQQAQEEIRKLFHIELSDKTDAEDLDVFGTSEADAALLAISILLQGDRSEPEMISLLTEISNDIAEDGKWNEASADSVKAEIADLALSKDAQKLLPKYRTNVKGWGLSTTVPDFEKYIRRFASVENGLGVCGVDEKVGTVKNVTNKNSKKYYAKSYTDTSSSDSGKTRFICIDSTGVGKMWRVATDLEKDRFNWNPKNTKDGSFLNGPFTGEKMVWDADTLRYANDSEKSWNKSCVSYIRDTNVILDGQYSYYKCSENGWVFTLDTLNKDSFTDERDGKTYKTIGIVNQIWMAENLNYEYQNKDGFTYGVFCVGGNADCDEHGRLYTWGAAMDSICPKGWHLPSKNEFETLFNNIKWKTYLEQIGSSAPIGKKLKSKTGWNKDGNGTDEYGFTVIPAGGSDSNTVGINTGFWTSTEERITSGGNECRNSGECAVHLGFSWDSDTISVKPLIKHAALSVRCIKDSEE